RFGEDGVILVALRDILPGEEIAWDYSTTLGPDAWALPQAHGIAHASGPSVVE
ncbi:MAG: SET domain-containing protein-lysine N-methyltransferase, partial [Sphingomonas sp.]